MSAAVSSTTPHLEEELKNKSADNNNNLGVEPYNDGANSQVAEETEPEEDEDSKLEPEKKLDLGPQFTLKEQLEKDKDDKSLRKWKEQLLGSVDMSVVKTGHENLKALVLESSNPESKVPEVKILTLTITSPDKPDLTLPIPFTTDPKKSLFILKEGSKCQMKFTFTVSNNIVSGLEYTNVVWKTGFRVDSRKKMLGTFSPQQEPYTFVMEDETIPSGMFVRGTYAARTKFVDDDRKCYLDVSYYFEIRKN